MTETFRMFSDLSADAPTDLRAQLLRPRTPAPAGRTEAPDDGGAAVVTALPSAEELLSASPNVQRLCATYATADRRRRARSRRQKLGIAVLVAALCVGGAVLFQSGRLPARVVTDLVTAAAGASGIGLAVLGLLELSSARRLRALQGDRLLRALQFRSALQPERLQAFVTRGNPTAAFFACYELWARQQPVPGASGLLQRLARRRTN